MNQWVLLSTFPSITMEFMDDWWERGNTSQTFVFDRVLLADRAAAIHGHIFLRTQRTAGNAFALPGSVHWWQPIRNRVVNAAGLTEFSYADYTERLPVITYISRQGWGRRMLIQEHHERLVQELYQLRDDYGYEVNVVSMDKLTRAEQMVLAGRTTVSFHLIASRHVSSSAVDNDGRARKRSHVTAVDETNAEVYSDGILLPGRFRARLRVHDPCSGYGALRILG